MKKFALLLLIAFGFALAAEAQTPSGVAVPIVTYQINTTGHSNGLTITDPFYISVESLTAEIDTSVGFMLLAYSITSTDAFAQNKIVNDSLPSFKIFPMTIAEVDTMTLDEMVESKFKARLDAIYGGANVVKQ